MQVGRNVDVQNLKINYRTAYFYRNVRTDPKGVGEEGLFYNFKQGIRKWLGGKKQPEPSLPLRQYPSILKQRNLTQQISPASLRANEFFDYLVNPEADMINVEMEMRNRDISVDWDAVSKLFGTKVSPPPGTHSGHRSWIQEEPNEEKPDVGSGIGPVGGRSASVIWRIQNGSS